MQVTIIGIGNTLATDDGVGIRAIEHLRNVVSDERVCFTQSERGGLDLLDLLEGHSRAFIIDAAWTHAKPPGTITVFNIRKPFVVETLPSLHSIGLRTVLAFGATVGTILPGEVTVYTVEAKDIETFHEGCTPEVEEAIQAVTGMVVMELQKMLPGFSPTAVDSLEGEQPLRDTTSMECV
jgi:hydrogenase maturation protease